MITTPDLPVRHGGCAELMRRRCLMYLDLVHERLLALEAHIESDAALELLGEACFASKGAYEIVLLGIECGGGDMTEAA